MMDTLQEQIFRLGEIELGHMYLIKEWRNAQIDVLRQEKPLTDADQLQYYERVIVPARGVEKPELSLFMFYRKDDPIGYGGLTNIDYVNHRAEVSFLLDPEYVKDPEFYERAFTEFLELIRVYGFKEMKLNRIFTETFDMRPQHIAILEGCGFHFEARLEQHVFIGGEPYDSLIHACINPEVTWT